ncbi:Nop domain-containing protein [Sarocladium strictum]
MASNIDFALYESPVGYALFKVVSQADTVGLKLKETQESVNDVSKFSKMVKLANFSPFRGHVEALENINLVSEGIVSDYLKNILELNLPNTSGKKTKIVLGVSEKNLAGGLKAAFPGLQCETADTNDVVADVIRGIRLHADKLLKDLKHGDVEKAGLGMGHAYSRAKVKFSVTRNDNHIIQASATIDFQDKGVNQFFMRVREWYGWHFPELVKIESDNYTYCKLVLAIGDKKTLTDDKLHDLAAVVGEDGEKAQAIIDAAKVSMGLDISAADLEIVMGFATAVVKQAENRKTTSNYLDKKLGSVAPNLQALIGTPVAARLISHAGSLTNLSKYPASTLQILGAEKALFRALKSKSNTPKYGLIYHSSFIGKAGVKNKGRISRYLANKCSMASRIDNFTEEPSTRFGEALKQQVEDRLEFYATGKKPAKNADVMHSVMQIIDGEGEDEEMDDAPAPASAKKEKKEKKDRKDKKEKKEKKRKHEDVEMEEAPTPKADGEKKKKKKRKSQAADDE